MKKRRPYLLLEIMIAVAILVLCIMPFVGRPTALLRMQVHSIEEAVMNRQAAIDFTEIKKLLYQQEKITWEMLCNTDTFKKQKAPALTFPPVTVYSPEKREFNLSLFFYTKKKKSNLNHRLVEVKLRYESLNGEKKTYDFEYQIYAKKIET